MDYTVLLGDPFHAGNDQAVERVIGLSDIRSADS